MDGSFLIGGERVNRSETFQAISPSTGEALDPPFGIATAADVERACGLADAAFDTFRETAPEARARFLERVATRIEELGDALVDRACAESGLPPA